MWFGSGVELPMGYARQLDGNGGMRKRGGVTLKSDLSDLSDKMGASRYTPRVCLPQFVLARAKSCRWGVQAA